MHVNLSTFCEFFEKMSKVDCSDMFNSFVIEDTLWLSSVIFIMGLTGLSSSSLRPVNLILSLEIMYMGMILSYVSSWELAGTTGYFLVVSYLMIIFAAVDSVVAILLLLLSSDSEVFGSQNTNV